MSDQLTELEATISQRQPRCPAIHDTVRQASVCPACIAERSFCAALAELVEIARAGESVYLGLTYERDPRDVRERIQRLGVALNRAPIPLLEVLR